MPAPNPLVAMHNRDMNSDGDPCYDSPQNGVLLLFTAAAAAFTRAHVQALSCKECWELTILPPDLPCPPASEPSTGGAILGFIAS